MDDYLEENFYGMMLVDGFVEISVYELSVDELFQNYFCEIMVWGLVEFYFLVIMGY